MGNWSVCWKYPNGACEGVVVGVMVATLMRHPLCNAIDPITPSSHYFSQNSSKQHVSTIKEQTLLMG